LQIPPLSIQPLVENAIRHGLRKTGCRGTVFVSIKKMIDGVKITVSDDGVGMPLNEQEKLAAQRIDGGVGLRNIDMRLRKLYGTGLMIQSEPGKGTDVMFIIPLRGDQVD
jgi:sensor histidine kinase YesM